MFEIQESVYLVVTGEVGTVSMIDQENNQAEVDFKDGSQSVYFFNQLMKVNQ